MAVHLAQVNLITADVPAAVEFYRLLGLDPEEIAAEWRDWAVHHQNFDTAEGLAFDVDSLAFARGYWAGEAIGVGFAVTFQADTREEVDTLYDRLTEAGHRGLRAPFDAMWGARFALVLGPGGEAVGIMSPSDPAHTTPPPDPATFD